MIALIILVVASLVLLLMSGRRALDGPGQSIDPAQRRFDHEFRRIVSRIGPLPLDTE